MKKIFYVAICIMACLVSCEEKELVSPKNPTTDNPRTDNPTIEEPITEENGHAYVDLGLSVKWATCNVGADSPEEYGEYFAWGETKSKDYYDWSTYKWCKGDYHELTKYCNDSYVGYNGFVDNKMTLDLSDDAARANWGGNWRMPTNAEQDELSEQCTWALITQNGVYGHRVTSKKNGRSIFLPLAGYRFQSKRGRIGSDSYYWSSSCTGGISSYILLCGTDLDYRTWWIDGRNYGLSVRPVCP